MSTLHLSDSLLDGYVAMFRQLAPKDQTILLDALAGSAGKKTFTSPNGKVLVEGEDFYYLPAPPGSPSFEEVCGAWADDPEIIGIFEELHRKKNRLED